MIDILVIEDIPDSQEFIRWVLSESGEYILHLACTGEEGLKLARSLKPDAIILDVNLPGINGYDVCRELKGDDSTKDIPIVFLSAHSDLEERMQGFEAGGDDYLVKPCDPETLRAKVKVVLRYRDDLQQLQQQYQQASEVAHIAMAGSSELGLAMQFVSNSYGIQNYDDLATAFLSFCDALGLRCSLMIINGRVPLFLTSQGIVSPLEQELLSLQYKEQRIVDFGQRTIINFPSVSLLVKNMPVEDAERYGRIKDLLPIILSALNSQVFSLSAESKLLQQSKELAGSFNEIKLSLSLLSETLTHNQHKGVEILRKMLLDMNELLPKLALEEDQETSILNNIEYAVEASSNLTDTSAETDETFRRVILSLENLLSKQSQLIDEVLNSKKQINDAQSSLGKPATDVDLF